MLEEMFFHTTSAVKSQKFIEINYYEFSSQKRGGDEKRNKNDARKCNDLSISDHIHAQVPQKYQQLSSLSVFHIYFVSLDCITNKWKIFNSQFAKITKIYTCTNNLALWTKFKNLNFTRVRYTILWDKIHNYGKPKIRYFMLF